MLISIITDMKLFFLASSLVFAIAIAGSPVLAADPGYRESEARLQQLRMRIEQVQEQLREERSRQDEASERLRKLDEKVAAVASRQREIEGQLDKAAKRVAALRQDVSSQRQRIAAHREQLARQIRAQYANGNGGYLKLMLSEEDPMRLGRILAYYRYFQAAHRAEMDAAAAEILRLSELEQALASEVAVLEDLRTQEQQAQQELAAAREQRVVELERIAARVAARGDEMARLNADAASLERLLEKLRDALADVKDVKLDAVSFRNRRGRLDWPLSGGLLARFGEDRGIGHLRWSGVLIEGKPGAAVQAVAHGHVVFADWLRGFGLLMIVDHGDGFMTLYGHNESLYAETGAWVKPGDVIASVGTGGSQRKPSLYFEVRSDGKPVDPMRWLRASKRG